MEKDGKRILYPGVVVAGTWTTDDIVDTIAQRSSFSSGCVKGVVEELSNFIVNELRNGYNVKIDELGTFSLSLSSREVTDKTEIRSASIEIEKVNFRPVPDLARRIGCKARLERAECGFAKSSKKYSKAERWVLLKEYLEAHGAITRLAYSELTGLVRSTAARELKRWMEEGILDTKGRHSHAVYVLTEKEQL